MIKRNYRTIYESTEKLTDAIKFKAEISPELHCLLCIKSPCNPLSCLCFPTVSSKAAESAYIHVYENRVEYNYPMTTCTWGCSCHVVDDIKTIYFDRAQMGEIYAWGGCCCGYDKTVILKQPCTNCTDVNVDHCCGRICLPCIENAPALVIALNEQKTKRLTELNLITTMERN